MGLTYMAGIGLYRRRDEWQAGVEAVWPYLDGRTSASHRPFTSADLPAEQTPALPSEQRNPYRPVGAKRSAPLRRVKKSLWSPDRNLKTAATDFKEAT